MREIRQGAEKAGLGGLKRPFDGLLLAMDTSGREGSAALATPMGGDPGRLQVLARISLRAEEEHASLLVPRIQALLEEVGAGREELSGILVGAGPGSFTGVRVGAATAKGFARALNLPLWAFSSLAAAAVEDGSPRNDEGWKLWEATGDRAVSGPMLVIRVADEAHEKRNPCCGRPSRITSS